MKLVLIKEGKLMRYILKSKRADETEIINYFLDIILKKDIKEIERFLKYNSFTKILKNETVENYIGRVIYMVYKKDKNFVKALLSNEEFAKSDLFVPAVKNLIEVADKNKIDELIDFLLDDGVAGGIIRKNISSYNESDEEEVCLNNILWYASKNKLKFNFERLVIKLLEKEDIVRNLPECLLKCLSFIFAYFDGGRCPVDIIKTILESEYIVDLIYKEPSFGKLFSKIPSYKYVDAFDIFFDDKIICEIGSDDIQGLFLDSTKSEKINILKKLLSSTTAIEKLWKEDVLGRLKYSCRKNETKVISLLINNDIILNKILKCPDKLVECFDIAYNNNYIDTVHLLLDNEKIYNRLEEKIGEEEIINKMDDFMFINYCNSQNISEAEDFILKNPSVLTKENIDKANSSSVPLLYNILNKKDFNEEDIKVVKMLISKGLKIGETSMRARKNINKIVDYMRKEGCNLKRQYYGITNRQKLEKTKIAIEDIGESLRNENLNYTF